MKKAIIAMVIIIALLAAAAVGVTAYASNGYTLPVSEWGDRLGIDSDKQPDEQEKPDDTTPGGQIPGDDTQNPDEELPGDSTEEPSEEESKPVFTKFESRRYFLSENGEETKSNASPLKEMFKELQPIPVDTLVVYGADEGYPIVWNSDKAALPDFLKRILHRKKQQDL